MLTQILTQWRSQTPMIYLVGFVISLALLLQVPEAFYRNVASITLNQAALDQSQINVYAIPTFKCSACSYQKAWRYTYISGWNHAQEEWQRAWYENPQNPFIAYHWGLALFDLNRIEEAIEVWNEISPASAVAQRLAIKAEVLLDHHEPQIALDFALAGVALNTNSGEPFFRAGQAYAALGKHKEAVSAWNNALKSSFQVNKIDYLYRSYYLMANSYYALGQIDTSLMFFDKAIGFQPHESSAYVSKARVLRQLKKYKEAKEVLYIALSAEKNDIHLYIELGNLAMEQQNWELAEDYFSHIASIEPKNKVSAYYLGLLAYRQNEYLRAIDYLEIARKNDVQPIYTHLFLARSLRHVNRIDEARNAYEFIYKLAGVNIEMIPYLEEYAMLLQDIGDDNDAKVIWGRVLKLDPNNQRALRYLNE